MVTVAENRASAERILRILFEYAKPQSVLDVGCGRGAWLAVARELGISDVHGVECHSFDRSRLVVDPALVTFCDLEQGLSLGRRFDLAMCLEVAEHLCESAAQTLVAALARHGDLILFSAAIPHQGGDGHINERFPDYWAALFACEGYRPLDFIRPRIWNDPNVLWWFPQNTLVFAHDRVLAANERLRQEQDTARMLSVVHPNVYLPRLQHARHLMAEHQKLIQLLGHGGTFTATPMACGRLNIRNARGAQLNIDRKVGPAEGIDMPPDLTTFARNLSWMPALMDCCHAWLDACRDLLDERFRAYCEGNAKLAWLLTAYLGLPEGFRKQFLLSPPVSARLRDARQAPAFADLAPDFVRVLARSSARAAADPDVAGMLAAFGRDYGELRGIPLDFDSTFLFPDRGPKSGELRVLQPDRAAQSRQCLEAAFDALEQGNPIALDYVCLLTQRLAVREDLSGYSGSSSFGDLIGFNLITNVWTELVDTARLVDALVHESIHAGLFLYEAVQGSLISDKTWPNLLRSPWTGTPLNCYQYVQACFVWFGLAQLWRSWPTAAGGVSAERAGQMHRQASEGFQARPVESLLNHAGERLVPLPVQDALRWVEQCALQSWGH
jgi:SAM-dependent methyltransferase